MATRTMVMATDLQTFTDKCRSFKNGNTWTVHGSKCIFTYTEVVEHAYTE
jgi:hypothetical protein